MPDKKLTDDEIIKAFECCADINDKCPECPLKDKNRESCVGILRSNALALITRQQSEIERLKKQIVEVSKMIKSEAVKEFAERLCDGKVSNDKTVIEVKVLLKEMVGDNDGNT